METLVSILILAQSGHYHKKPLYCAPLAADSAVGMALATNPWTEQKTDGYWLIRSFFCAIPAEDFVIKLIL
jgi:hypothetical protein